MMDNNQDNSGSRRSFLKTSTLGLGSLLIGTSRLSGMDFPAISNREIQSYCIDFNWGEGGPNAFAKPGLWSGANPRDHIRWYKNLGCNVLQTFAVSSNGYAWYKNGVVPAQPGLKHDFLTEMVKLGHDKGMKVMGYFCVGANTRWGLDHPEWSYGIPASPHIPLCSAYLDYLGGVIGDALEKTGMDGFMIDWVWNPALPDKPLKWLKCEQEMFEELMDRPFPGKEKIDPASDLQFRKKAINRCWKRIKQATNQVKPGAIIWLSCSDLARADVQGSPMCKEVDWLMNEAGDIKALDLVRDQAGTKARLITCLANWNKQDPLKIVPEARDKHFGLYGFTKPGANSLPDPVRNYLSFPVSHFEGDARNIAVLARAYNKHRFDYRISKSSWFPGNGEDIT